ncbi:MAG: 4'-phosphopantetheinyl transferase superfamily protein [Desulfobacula sp.]|nr:4'-phosphopantetheinyl transferase superfamily protein [Desulfobacula sp.]
MLCHGFVILSMRYRRSDLARYTRFFFWRGWMEGIVLKPGEVHFFYTRVNEIQTPLLLEKYRDISSDKEKTKIDRYVFGRDRHNCLVTRGLLRFVLSWCTGICPSAFGFEENAYGKPGLIPGVTDIPIQFNLSHAGGLTACAVVLDHEIGIDVEDATREIDVNIADRFFSPQEADYLGQTRAQDKKAVFFDFWTLKESYIKAKGKGLSIPLDKFSFTIGKNSTLIGFDTAYTDTPENFSFFRFPLLKKFKAAITLQAPKTKKFDLSIYQCVPFQQVKRQDQIQII